MTEPVLRFTELNLPLLHHAFTLRSHGPLQQSCYESLLAAHFPCDRLVEAEQPHGNRIAQVNLDDSGKVIPDVDGLMTDQPGLTLAIRTADCGPIFLYDHKHHAIGVVHSGKKGTEARILEVAIQAMGQAFQSNPADIQVVLGPCIRPPHYDSDFASEIRKQAEHSGILNYSDCLMNTGQDLQQFYSYRMEKGQTGRHYAAMRLDPLPDKS